MRPIPLIAAALLLATPTACDDGPAAAVSQAVQGPVAGPDARRSSTTGLDAQRLTATVQTAATLPRLHSLIVARDGEVVAERVFRGPDLDRPVNIKSASKSVLSALVGVAVGQGVIASIDQPVSTWLAADFPADPDPRLNAITVENLLSMQAGLGSTSGGNYGAWVTSRNWVRHALARPFEAEPGGAMIYSSGTSHLTSALLTRATGRSTLELARDWLGEPLGVTIPAWPADAQGVYFGGNDMLMSPRALLVFGELYRNGGVHEGARLLPEGWVENSWRQRTASRYTGDAYGLGWFTRQVGGHAVRYAWGYGGQMVYVVPSLGLTVVMTSDPSPVAQRDDHVSRLHALMADGLIPAAEAGA